MAKRRTSRARTIRIPVKNVRFSKKKTRKTKKSTGRKRRR